MRYSIKLWRKLGTNTYESFKVESTENEDEFRKHLVNLEKTFKRCGYNPVIEYYANSRESTAYITIGE